MQQVDSRDDGEAGLLSDIKTEFQATLGLLHIALVTHYGLGSFEANELETDLYLWFRRFCQRPGAKTPRESRQYLIVACCEFARDYQRYVIDLGERTADERLRSILDREPADVARDFSRGLELLKYRHRADA
jgi:hypothetical protein